MGKIQRINRNSREYHADDGTIVFVSFETPVAVLFPSHAFCFVTDYKWSITTGKQIGDFIWRWGKEIGQGITRKTIKQELIDQALYEVFGNIRMVERRDPDDGYTHRDRFETKPGPEGYNKARREPPLKRKQHRAALYGQQGVVSIHSCNFDWSAEHLFASSLQERLEWIINEPGDA